MAASVRAAGAPRSTGDVRLLVVHGDTGNVVPHPPRALPELLEPGDLVVLNDAATVPASLVAREAAGSFLEIRLASALGEGASAVRFRAALLGRGDHRTRTEDRPPPPRVRVGDLLHVLPNLVARVLAVATFSERLVDLELTIEDPQHAFDTAAVWAALYRVGRPVQYAHVLEPLALWDVQNVWAGRPWAFEMPSAGRALRGDTLLALRRRGIAVETITHEAGLSSTGDPAIDARLPLPERFDVPGRTARAIVDTKVKGGRVIAVGTSVVRALESAARIAPGHPASGTTDLVLTPRTPLLAVDAIVTGVHEADTTHFMLLGAFADRRLLDAALGTSAEERFLGHEHGDAWLVWARAKPQPAHHRNRDTTDIKSPLGLRA